MELIRRYLLLAIISLFPILVFITDLSAIETPLPFNPGEKMIFRVKWEFVPAGKAILEVMPFESVNGKQSFHFVFTARTNKYVDFFYKVRDRVDSYVDIKMTRSVLYKKEQKGNSKQDIVVTFDWKNRLAHYSGPDNHQEPIIILPGTFDPLSVFFAYRLYDLNKTTKVITPVTDGKRCVLGNAERIKKERIKVLAGEYDTYLVEPEMENIDGVFKKSKNAKLQIWVTADDRRIPVQIKSKIAVGSFVAELVSYEEGIPE
ncbi:DUF3108 domain-containing protein [Thermodesulfobacteriota bacterium]